MPPSRLGKLPTQRSNAPPSGERAFLAALRRRAARHTSGTSGLRLGIGDDCAILRPDPRDEIVVTTDLFLEQVHFRRDWHQPEVAGHRCLARGLSDIAAMGARPIAAFLSFALPPELAGEWASRFLAGLLRLASKHNVPLAGGDTAQAPAHAHTQNPASAPTGALFTADIVLLGVVRRGKALLRSGAQPGDAIYVSGAVGGAAAELARLQLHPARYAGLTSAGPGHPHLFPIPRLALGAALLGKATAAIDVSDGPSTDLAHLCTESAVAAEIEAALLPIHPLALASAKSFDLALNGGEDYELLFTAPASRRIPPRLAGTPVHRIGTILKPSRSATRGTITLVQPDGSRQPLHNAGWEHFRPSK
jgi:thiamine-monophosphate kinase